MTPMAQLRERVHEHFRGADAPSEAAQLWEDIDRAIDLLEVSQRQLRTAWKELGRRDMEKLSDAPKDELGRLIAAWDDGARAGITHESEGPREDDLGVDWAFRRVRRLNPYAPDRRNGS
jgi:hypothetical protein